MSVSKSVPGCRERSYLHFIHHHIYHSPVFIAPTCILNTTMVLYPAIMSYVVTATAKLLTFARVQQALYAGICIVQPRGVVAGHDWLLAPTIGRECSMSTQCLRHFCTQRRGYGDQRTV